MKRLEVVAAALAAVIGAPAMAADMPVKTPTPAKVASVYNWTGFYTGGNAGFSWGHFDTTYNPSGPPNGVLLGDQASISAAGSRNFNSDSFVGGVQVGFNYQFATNWVLGIEADFQAFDFSGSFNREFFTALGNQQFTHTAVGATWLFTTRGRLGYAADRLLIYGTGGLAVAKINFNQVNTLPDYPFTDIFSVSDTKTGWAAGGGVEYAFLNNWSVKVEYLYVDLGTVSGTSSTVALNPAAPGSFGHNADFRANIVRAGFNYKFY